MMKRIFCFLIVIILILLLCTSCQSFTDPEQENANLENTDRENSPSLAERAEMVTEGMTYGEIKALMGSDGVDIGSGVFLFEWVLSENEVLRVGMVKPKDQIQTDASNHDDLIATKVSIEEKED